MASRHDNIFSNIAIQGKPRVVGFMTDECPDLGLGFRLCCMVKFWRRDKRGNWSHQTRFMPGPRIHPNGFLSDGSCVDH